MEMQLQTKDTLATLHLDPRTKLYLLIVGNVALFLAPSLLYEIALVVCVVILGVLVGAKRFTVRMAAVYAGMVVLHLDAAKQAMERLGIYEYRTHHPNTLSGGQKQRAAVAVSMVCRKDVLIFDEPTSGLDYDSMIQVAGLFQTLSKMGKVIFVVTHDYEFLAAACTRVIHLDNGKQQEDYPLSPDNLHRLRDFFLRSERRPNFEENGK